MAVRIEPLYGELGRRIQQRRQEMGYSQERLASRLDPPTTRASIGNIESGKQRVLVHTLIQLCSALEVPPGLLLSEGIVSDGASASAAYPHAVTLELEKKLNIPSKAIQRLTRQFGVQPRGSNER